MSKLTPDCQRVDPTPGSLCNITNSPYGFQLELWPGIVYSTIFGVLMLSHVGLLAYHKGHPKFMWIAVVGAAGETAGWIARAIGAPYPFDRNAYLAQIICLILSPAFISAVNYVAFQNVMDVYGHKWSRIPRKWYVLGFVAGDICSLVVQAVGGALSAEAGTVSEGNTGKAVMIAGVTIQVAVTAPFLSLYLDYNIRRLREWSRAKLHPSERPAPKLETFNAAIGVSTLFILVRCIYRIVEMADGWKGYLATNEVYFDILDALMVTFAIAVFIPFHPGFYLPRHISKMESGSDASNYASEGVEKPQKIQAGDSHPTSPNTVDSHTTANSPHAAHSSRSSLA